MKKIANVKRQNPEGKSESKGEFVQAKRKYTATVVGELFDFGENADPIYFLIVP